MGKVELTEKEKELVTIKVHSLLREDAETMVVVGINNYSKRFNQDVEVKVPRYVAVFLRDSRKNVPYYDEKHKDEFTGFVGKHKFKKVKRWAVELVEKG